jgi:hypothetical protein
MCVCAYVYICVCAIFDICSENVRLCHHFIFLATISQKGSNWMGRCRNESESRRLYKNKTQIVDAQMRRYADLSRELLLSANDDRRKSLWCLISSQPLIILTTFLTVAQRQRFPYSTMMRLFRDCHIISSHDYRTSSKWSSLESAEKTYPTP